MTGENAMGTPHPYTMHEMNECVCVSEFMHLFTPYRAREVCR